MSSKILKTIGDKSRQLLKEYTISHAFNYLTLAETIVRFKKDRSANQFEQVVSKICELYKLIQSGSK
jgi:hypothetical protein